MKQVKTVIGDASGEPTIEREAGKPVREKRPAVDRADPHPSLPRRTLFRERRPEDVG